METSLKPKWSRRSSRPGSTGRGSGTEIGRALSRQRDERQTLLIPFFGYWFKTPSAIPTSRDTDLMTRRSRVPQTTKRRQVAALQKIAPSSRHREIDDASAQQHEDVSVRELAS